MQYRTNRADCVHRYFTGGNGSTFNDPFVYNSEAGAIASSVSKSCFSVGKLVVACQCFHSVCFSGAGLHEMLLQSEHRTLDPEEADYFYLPVSELLPQRCSLQICNWYTQVSGHGLSRCRCMPAASSSPFLVSQLWADLII